MRLTKELNFGLRKKRKKKEGGSLMLRDISRSHPIRNSVYQEFNHQREMVKETLG
jgi:hypothetical protein